MAIPDFPDYRPLSCGHETELEAALRECRPEISEFSLGFLYGYLENFDFHITRVNGSIGIFGNVHGSPSFLPLIGGNTAGNIKACLEFLIGKYGKGRINSTPKSIAPLFMNDPRFKVTDDRNDYDYVYRVRELAELAGSKYQSKRNFAQQFEQRYTFEYRELTKDIIVQCMELQEKWCDLKACGFDESMSMEKRFVYKLLNNFGMLNLFGAALLIDGNVEAFTIAEGLTPQTAILHIEKANTGFRGIYQAINNMFARRGLAKFEFVNREQDVGSPGLRKAKLSYHPHHFVEKYNIELSNIPPFK